MIVGDFDEYCSSKTDTLTGWDDEAQLLNEFRIFPLRVAGDGLIKPLVGDWRAVQMAGRHEREFEEGRCSSIQHLNVYGVDLL